MLLFYYVSTCANARWNCKPATVEEQSTLANRSSSQLKCRESHNEEFTECEPLVQLTCKASFAF